jgi:hypothetical protein
MKAPGVRARGIYLGAADAVGDDLRAGCVHLLDGEESAVEAVSVVAVETGEGDLRDAVGVGGQPIGEMAVDVAVEDVVGADVFSAVTFDAFFFQPSEDRFVSEGDNWIGHR